MALQYGFNIPASDAKTALEQNEVTQEGVRYWSQQFGTPGLAMSGQSDALTSYYSDAMAEAYRTNFLQKEQIYGAGLNVGATSELLRDNALDLRNTYDKYMSNYNENLASVTEDYAKQLDTINTALTSKAENLSALYSSPIDYLYNELYGSTYTTQDKTKPIYGKVNGKTVITGYEDSVADWITENRLDWLTDTTTDELTGEETRELKSRDQLSRLMFDESGALTDLGKEFYEKMFYAQTQGYTTASGDMARSFGEYLSDTDNELYNWWAIEDSGANIALTKKMSGLDPTKQAVAPSDYMKATDIVEFDEILESDEMTAFDKKLADTTAAFAGEEYALSLIERQYDNARKYQQTTQAKVASDEYQAAVRSLKKRTLPLESEYKTYMSEIVADFNTKLKETMGTELYNTFVEQNKKLYETITAESGLANQQNPKNYMSDYEKSFTSRKEAYQKLLAAAKKYIEMN